MHKLTKLKFFLDKQKTKTLFLDLDETLIHSCLLSENPQYVVEGDIFQGESAVIFY